MNYQKSINIFLVLFFLCSCNSSQKEEKNPPKEEPQITVDSSSILEDLENQVYQLSFCEETLSVDTVSAILSRPVELNVNSPDGIKPKSCVFRDESVQLTVMAFAGKSARSYYEVNLNRLNKVEDLTELSALGTASSGFFLEDRVVVDIFKPGIWMNLSISGGMDKQKKIEAIKQLGTFLDAAL